MQAITKSARKGAHSAANYMVSTPGLVQANLETLVQKYDRFIFDCDGVLFHSHDEIGDAFAALNYIKSFSGKEIYFFTNATTRTRETLLNKKLIEDHNFRNIALENLYTASYLTSLYVKDELIPRVEKSHGITEPSVYVIGENGFKHELR